MDDHLNLGELLNKVDPKLISQYEKIHLQGDELKDIIEKYEAVGNIEKLILRTLYVFLVVVVFCGSLFLLSETWYIAKLPILILLTPVIFYAFCPLRKRINTVSTYRPLLKDFKAAVIALNPINVVIEEYNETTVKNILVNLAVMVLTAEKRFAEACRENKLDRNKIMQFAHQIERCQVQLKTSLDQTRKFGLDYKKSNLFAEAKKYLEAGKSPTL